MKLEIDEFEKICLLNAIEEEIDLLKRVRKPNIHQSEELDSLNNLQKRINSETSHNSRKIQSATKSKIKVICNKPECFISALAEYKKKFAD